MTRIRPRLLLIATVAIVPLALMAAIALEALLAQQRHQAEEAALNLTRALATAIDNELRLTVSALQSLALTEPFGAVSEDGLAAARVLATKALAARPEWQAVLLALPSGDVVLNTVLPAGTKPPRVTELKSIAEVVRTGAPAVGPLATGPLGNRGIPVRVPVLRDGALRYVLSAVVKPEAIVAVVNRQRVPAVWTVSVFDSENVRVARSRDHDKLLGTSPGESLSQLMATLNGRDEGFGQSSTLEGERVNTALARIKSAGWTVTLGMPRSVGEQAFWRSVLVFGGGIVLSVVLAAFAARFASRRIEHAIARLRDAAGALGRGDPVQLTDTGIAEIEATSEALVAAAARRAQSERERESLLDAEREARTTAEQAERRLQLLVAASSSLSTSLEEGSALTTIATSIVPDIADLCRIDLLNGEGVLERKVTHHRDPERTRAITGWVARSVASADAPGTFPWAIATGQTFVGHFDDAAIAAIADPGVAEFVRVVGLRAACVMPLVARGRTIGAMAVIQAESGRRFEADDVALVGEIARRAALALDNVRLFAESRAALAQAQSAGRVKDEFLAMLGHELRNPLAPIVTSLELMARREGPVGAPERHVIERQVKHLSRLVDDLLDVSRIAPARSSCTARRIDLREVVGRALELARPALAGRFVSPVVAAAGAAGVGRRRPDAAGAGRLQPAHQRRQVHAAGRAHRHRAAPRSAAQALLSVADDGDGIPRELLEHIFERFVQGDQSLQRARGGLGLGLAIVRNIVELHGGTRDGRRATASARAAASRSRCPRRRRRRLLRRCRCRRRPRRHRRLRRRRGSSSSTTTTMPRRRSRSCSSSKATPSAPRRRRALALAMFDDFVPDVAFLDIGLPDLNGYELARAIRTDPRAARTRLVALTGYGREPDRQLATQAGFDRHLVKPAEIEDLLAAIGPRT